MPNFLDRRNRAQCKMVSAFVLLLICVWGSIAYAATEPIGESDWKWQAAFVLQALVTYIYISGNNRTAKSIEKLFALIGKLNDEVVTEEHHKQIDHSMLCPKCRR